MDLKEFSITDEINFEGLKCSENIYITNRIHANLSSHQNSLRYSVFYDELTNLSIISSYIGTAKKVLVGGQSDRKETLFYTIQITTSIVCNQF